MIFYANTFPNFIKFILFLFKELFHDKKIVVYLQTTIK
jgi:hypothetical protein